VATPPSTAVRRQPAVAWSWSRALVGVVYAVPAAVVATQDPAKGLPLALGVLPAALMPMPPRRSARVRILLLGSLAGFSIFLGGVITRPPTVVTALLLVAAVVAAALAAAARPLGQLVLQLCAPLAAAGLSYGGLAHSAGSFLLLTVGAAYAWLVSLLWPEHEPGPRPSRALPDRRAMLSYGVRMGVAAALAYLITSSLGLDHPGWAPAACLLVARPQVDLLETRGIGRVASVVVGGLVAGVLLHLAPPDGVYAVCALAVVACTAATLGSRWYITSGFTTFLVLLMILLGHEGEAVSKLNERVLETVLGVGLAYLFGWALPSLTRALSRERPVPTEGGRPPGPSRPLDRR
jgi:uncharacterized membrane protein YgaE (UPF0421/DUF939 family)